MPRERRWCRSRGSCESLLEDKSKSRESIMKGRKDSENGLMSDSSVWTLSVPGGKYVCGLSANTWEWDRTSGGKS